VSQYILRRENEPANFKIDYKKELNPEQLEVVLNGDGPCLVLAGAGSGKTRTIVYRVAYLLEKGVRPEEILLVTFTNKAAREMLDRITQVFGAYPKGVWGGTFHHIAHILLRKYARAIGYEPNFTILDQEDALSLLKIVLKDLYQNPPKGRFPSASAGRWPASTRLSALFDCPGRCASGRCHTTYTERSVSGGLSRTGTACPDRPPTMPSTCQPSSRSAT